MNCLSLAIIPSLLLSNISAMGSSRPSHAIPAAQQLTAIAAPSLGAPGEAVQSLVWPAVDSVKVMAPVVGAGHDTLFLRVYITNPGSTPAPNVRVSPHVREFVSGYQVSLPPRVVTLQAASQTLLLFQWIPALFQAGLQYSVQTELTIPYFPKSPAACENLIANGTFNSGCSGWTLVENYPPTLGAECTAGYMKVYSSIYNTTDRRTASAYQAVNIGSGGYDTWEMRYRARYYADDGFYGVGVAGTYVAFYNSSNGYIGGLYQLASTAANPPDSPVEHYGRAAEGQWIYYSETLNSLLAYVPGVPKSSVAYVRIGALAYPRCSAPYCNPSSYVYLDDVEFTNCSGTSATSDETVVVSAISSEISGDYRQILQDCFGGAVSCEPVYLDLVPLASTPSMWKSMKGYLCAAGVYQDMGDNVAKGFAEFFAVKSLFDPILSFARLLALGQGTNLSEVAWKAFLRGYVGTAAQCAKSAIAQSAATKARQSEGTNSLASTAHDLGSGMSQVLAGQGETLRFCMIMRGAAEPSVEALGSVTNGQTVRHIGILVDSLISPDWFLIAVDDSAKTLGAGLTLGAEDVVTVSAAVVQTGVVELVVYAIDPQGARKLLTYEPIAVAAGTRLSFAWSQDEVLFGIAVDADGDGTPDETRFPSVVSGVAGPPQSGESRAVQFLYAGPSPFASTIHFAVRVPEDRRVQVDILDVSGRRVCRLNEKALRAGILELAWNGSGENGVRVASGLYFIRVTAGSQQVVRRIVLAR